MATIADYIAKNNAVVLELRNKGLIPISVMVNYEMYRMVKAIDNPKKMVVYEMVADRCKCSVDTVRKAVREMEKPT